MSEFREITPECRANRGDYPAFDQAVHDLWPVYGVLLSRHPDATFILTLSRKQPDTPAPADGSEEGGER